MKLKKVLALTFVTVLTMMLLAVCAFAKDTEVNTVEALMEALESDGDVNVVITDDIVHTCLVKDIGDYWITIGSGKKTLNLSGHNIELNADSGEETTMIRVPEGAELIIKDSSGDNSGTLWCYGRMEWATEEYSADSPFYFNSDVKYRNVLEIDGGMVTVYGGTLEAGRSKKQWIYNGRDVYDLRHMLEYAIQGGVLALAIGARYDGYAWQQVNGDCITVNDGTLLINDGVFLGRGFSHLETYIKENDNDVDVEFSKAAALRLLGGNTIINGGTFWGRGNADVVNNTKDANVTVKSGTFSTNHLRVLLVPTINTTLYGYYYPYVIGHEPRYGYHPASDVGNIRLTADMLDPQRNTLELDGEIVPVSEWTPKIISNTSVDGSSTIVVTHHLSNSDRRNYSSGRDEKKSVTRLNIDGTNSYGMTLSPDNLSCDAESVRSISVEWFHNDALCDEEEQMIAGKYQVKVTVNLYRGYAFSEKTSFTIMGDAVSKSELSGNKTSAVLYSKVYEFDCNHSYNEDTSRHFDSYKHFLLCSVCNEIISSEEHYFDDGEQNGDVITYKCMGCDYAYEELDDGTVKINYVYIDIPEPKAGMAPDYNGVISGEGVKFADGGDEYTKNGIRWGKYANDFGIGEKDVFAGGLAYRANISLCAEDGYSFHKNHTGEYDVLVFVNGQQVKYEVDGNIMSATYETNAGEVWISYVDMMGIDFPEIGKTPDTEPESAYPYYYDANNDYGSVLWYEDGEYMDKSDTFKEGKTYTVTMYVDTIRTGWDDVAVFDETVSATLNGFEVDTKDVEKLGNTTVMISYTFPKLEKFAEFDDIDNTKYYYDAVNWAYENGVTSGISETAFGPEENCTRGQVVTFLYRAAGSPKPKTKNCPFTDVKKSDYYYDAVLWAVENGITAGTSADKFSPRTECSSAHIITFLYRAMGEGSDGWYKEAREWAMFEGLLDGTGLTVSPDESCPRGAVVTFLYRIYRK